MYEIIKDGAVLALTESSNYIRLHPDGVYILCEQKEAQGVAYNGTPYLFADGAICCEVDKGADILETERTVSDNDAMNVDQEYRLTLLELGLVE